MTLDTYRFPIQLAGQLCLNFTNTVEFRDSERRLEFLLSYEHVLAWCKQHELLGDEERAERQDSAVRHPAQAEAALQSALDLRETLYRIFTTLIDGAQPCADDLAQVNAALLSTGRQIVPDGSGFHWTWAHSDDLTQVLAPIALAAAELLTSETLQWVRQCPNCGWLFLDTSRNHTRRWCSMDFCGSQVKSRRQYERRKTAKV